MEYEKPVIEYNRQGALIKFIIGTCDSCGLEIDNSKESFIKNDKGKIHHACSKCELPHAKAVKLPDK